MAWVVKKIDRWERENQGEYQEETAYVDQTLEQSHVQPENDTGPSTESILQGSVQQDGLGVTCSHLLQSQYGGDNSAATAMSQMLDFGTNE